MHGWRRSLSQTLRLLVAVPPWAVGMFVALVPFSPFILAPIVLLFMFGYLLSFGLYGVVPDAVFPIVSVTFGIASVLVLVKVWQWERSLEENVRDEAAAMLVGTRPPVQRSGRDTRAILGRVCQTVGQPTPALRVARTDEPLCYTVRYPIESPPSEYLADNSSRAAFPSIERDWAAADEEPIPEQYVVVVSTGLLTVLSTPELEAVLAHEVAHLRNGDLWLMHWLLLPAHWGASLRDASLLWLPLTSIVQHVPLAGIVLFARGREVAADAGAARITGAPATLAAALERLDDELERPETDLRTVAVMNVLPTTSVDNRLGTTLSHPGTESRIERLRTMDPDRL